MAPKAVITVNGREHPISPTSNHSLLSALREDLHLTGAKYGCGEGACGACTVLVDNEPVRACVVPAKDVIGRSVRTIEGLAGTGGLHPVQQAFVDMGAMQCGYCTPGMVLSAVALLERQPAPTDRDIIAALDGNICRCCTYPRILNAVKRASDLSRRTK